MNGGKNLESNKTTMKMRSNNIFLSSNISHSSSQAQTRNIFLSPIEEERNGSNNLQTKLNYFVKGINTFSDYSADDSYNENNPNESSITMIKKGSAHSVGTLMKTQGKLNSEDYHAFDELNSNLNRKFNSHHSIQNYKPNNNDNGNHFNDGNIKKCLLSNEIRSKINSTNIVLKTYHLTAKRRFRGIGKTAHYIFTEGEQILFNIYQNKQQPNLFEVYSTDELSTPENIKAKITTNDPKSSSPPKSQQIQTGQTLTSINQSCASGQNPNTKFAKCPVAILQMLDKKGGQFMFYKDNLNGDLLLKIQYIKTNYSGYYRTTVVTFHKNDSIIAVSSTAPDQHSFSQPPSISNSAVALHDLGTNSSVSVNNESKKQRLWSKQPQLNEDGKPSFVTANNPFIIESIRNMDLCKKDQDKVYVSIRKTDQDVLKIDTFFKASVLWFVGISLSDALSSVF